MTDEEILERLRKILADNFEIDPGQVVPDANLFTELGLDSIDAVDLAIQLQQITGKRIQPHEFKEVRTIADTIAAVHKLLAS